MREFLQAINEYPLTTILLSIFILTCIEMAKKKENKQ